ncbi:hypothetical protein HYW84_04035 [Candidatus Peregrinibacteria bacterium]|nr:hypothetical protein [Candidatus Peregrinibacteria bacterium]
MGMNMVTIAAEAIGKWLEQNINRCVTLSGVEERPTIEFITVAANVDSDKKPSQRTHNRGRGYEVTATATVPADILQSVLKTTPESLLEIAHAKLELGSEIAGAIGKNCHAANIVAALYIATGQDPAHIVEGSLTDTSVSEIRNPLRPRSGQAPHEIRIATRLPALLGGIRGGGTTLPAQSQCLSLLLGLPGPRTQDLGPRLHACRRLAESIGGAVLAGELSLLAALASNHLAKSHASLARTVKT